MKLFVWEYNKGKPNLFVFAKDLQEARETVKQLHYVDALVRFAQNTEPARIYDGAVVLEGNGVQVRQL